MRLLDRYVIRNFVQVYFYCIAGFTSIWLIFDVSDNISSFIDNHIAAISGGSLLRHADPAGVHYPAAGCASAVPSFCARANVAVE